MICKQDVFSVTLSDVDEVRMNVPQFILANDRISFLAKIDPFTILIPKQHTDSLQSHLMEHCDAIEAVRGKRETYWTSLSSNPTKFDLRGLGSSSTLTQNM